MPLCPPSKLVRPGLSLLVALALPATALADYEPTGLIEDPFTDEDDARAVCVNDTTVYLVNEEGTPEQLHAYDVGDIAGASASFPTPQTSLEAGAFDSGVLCEGDVLYAWGTGGIRVYDVSDPLAPSLQTTISTSGSVYKLIAVHGNLLVAFGAFGAITYSAANPLAPVELDSADLPANQRAYTGTVIGTTLFLGVYDFDADGAILVSADFSDPADLGETSSAALPDFAYHFVPANGRLLAIFNGSAILYDVSNPAAPGELSSLPLSGRSLAIRGDDYIVNGVVFQVANARGTMPSLVQVDSFAPVQVTSGIPHFGAAIGDYALFMGSEGAHVLGDFLFIDGFESEDASAWSTSVGEL